MNILESLPNPLVKTSPDVWISRVTIFGKLTETPIRDISLKRGLNIVWAEEPDDEDDKRDVAGHSAGKTSFCRLLRYILGEKTFGNKSNMALIKRTFPNGYVAAELFVKETKWAVMRPLGENRNSYVLKGATIEELLEKRGEAAYQETYPSKIGLKGLLDPLESATVVRTNEPIEWGHLLAWCTRDQEARFQNIHDWRSPRSDSDWPSFRFPKSDPLFVMRIVLGLFLRGELEGEEALSKLQQTLEKQENALEVAKKEPAYWREHYDAQVRTQLQEILPEDALQIANAPIATDDILPDLKRFSAKAKFLMEEQLKEVDAAGTAIQNEINEINERIAADKVELQQLAALFKLEFTAEGEAVAGLKRDEEFRQLASANKDKVCPYGEILIGECSHVQDRQRLLQRNAIKDSHALEQLEAKRVAARERVTGQQRTLNQNIHANELKRKHLIEKQNRLMVELSQKRALQSALDTDLQSLIAWKARHESPDKYGKLHENLAMIEDLKRQIDEKKQELNRLLAEHDTNRELLNTIFSKAARQVLPSANYDGKVKLEDRELHFQITHGGTMTGEAMETLAVLLADIIEHRISR